MIPVLWIGGGGNWDAAFPRYILDQATPCDHIGTLDGHDLQSTARELPQSTAVICIPGRHATEIYNQIDGAAAYFRKVVFVVYGDEEGLFTPARLQHPDRKVWYFMPPFHPQQEGIDRVAINGWPTDCREILAEQRESVGERDLDWSFSGQVTHLRRAQCAEVALKLKHGEFFGTPGFTQGKPRPEYYHTMLRSKMVLCPSGPRTPDSFRIAEALEAGCIPIADELTPDPDYPAGYWKYAFRSGFLPFPVVKDWLELEHTVLKVLFDYQHYYFRCAQFWAEYKMRLINEMREDVRR